MNDENKYTYSIITAVSYTNLDVYKRQGWNTLVEEHRRAWQEIWDETDVVIEGDPEAQQGIRYNIFQLYQTYRGDDPRLNIGPKGFTGEKYGGNTYWNTELCCVCLLYTSGPHDGLYNDTCQRR